MHKINVNLPLCGALRDYAQYVNVAVSEVCDNYVDFSDSSPHMPHISLYMGSIRDRKLISQIESAIRRALFDVGDIEVYSFDLSVTDPDRRGNIYVFIDVQPARYLVELKKKIYEEVGRFFVEKKWFYIEEDPHITVGCVSGAIRQQVEECIHNVSLRSVSEVVSEVWISDVGLRGTCISRILSIPLRA